MEAFAEWANAGAGHAMEAFAEWANAGAGHAMEAFAEWANAGTGHAMEAFIARSAGATRSLSRLLDPAFMRRSGLGLRAPSRISRLDETGVEGSNLPALLRNLF